MVKGRGTLVGVQGGREVFVCQQLSHGLLMTEQGRIVDFLPLLKESVIQGVWLAGEL